MPTTRSKQPGPIMESPESPSDEAATATTARQTSTPPPTTTTKETMINVNPVRIETERVVPARGVLPTQGAASVRSTLSASARIKRLELDAEEKLASIRRKELELEASLIRKRLEADVAVVQDEGSEGSDLCEDNEVEKQVRTSAWVHGHKGEKEMATDRRLRISPEEKGYGRAPNIERTNATHKRGERTDRRSRSPTPRREGGLERLTEIMEALIRSRPPPRQAQELPIFSGAVTEWLPFKAAMRDSTTIYQYSRSENLARLRSCLRGEAKEAVAALLYSANDPEIIMRTLEQRFGRPEMLIDRALSEIKKLPRPGATAMELNTFAVKLQNIVCVLTTVDDRGYVNNPMLAREVTEKLSPHLRARWCDYAEEFGSREQPEIATLSQFLMREADRSLRYAYAAQATPTTTTQATPPRQSKGNGRKQYDKKSAGVYVTTENTNDKKQNCLCCGGQHDVPRCEKYLNMDVAQRWDWAKGEHMCFRCMNDKHRRVKCKAKGCGVDGCDLGHHATLHYKRQADPNAATVLAGGSEGPKAVMSTSASNRDWNAVLLKVCPVTVQTPYGVDVETYALLDEGSTISLIDEDFAHRLGVDGPSSAMNIHGINGTQRESQSKRIKLRIRGKTSPYYEEVSLRTVKEMRMGTQTVSRECLKYDHLRGLREEEVCFDMGRPTILIGADHWHLIVSRRLLVGGRKEPIASLTGLGWVIHGTVPPVIMQSYEDSGGVVLHIRTPEREQRSHVMDDELHGAVKAHFDIDSLGIKASTRLSAADKRAVDTFRETVTRVDGRYEVGLPWANENETLPPSYSMAEQRLRNVERKLLRSPELENEYGARIDDLIRKGYAEKCSGDEGGSPRSWWLPHFAVTNPNKPGKIRLVFDAAARSNGMCLNDALLDGPDLLQSLPGILFRFRERPIAIAADIREMFLRVKIRREDQPAQMFLWRCKERRKAALPPERFKMTSMIFGARSSPFLAHSVRDHNAELNKEEYPLAHYAITNSHYMDDLVDSYGTPEEAARVVHEVREVHARAGFEIVSWNSNDARAIEDVPQPLRADSTDAAVGRALGANAHNFEKTLGIRWHASRDELSFNTTLVRVDASVKNATRAPTKREALSAVMSLFDPLGLLSYFTITAKICLQRVWRLKIAWDEPLPPDLAEDFAVWLRGLCEIDKLRLYRCYSLTGGEGPEVTDLQLHVFCDASEDAYAAVAYWRIRRNSHVSVTLVAAKARVAPLRAQSVPRLELQAALIGARLAHMIVREHRYRPSRVVMWSDSITALQWIRNDTAKHTPYVAHRVTEITELTRPEQWRWVSTVDNVADEATRANEYIKTPTDRWFTGPGFLCHHEREWPVDKSSATDGDVECNSCSATENAGALPDISRFSSYERLVRATAYVIMFVEKCRRRVKTFKLRHIQRAETEWIKRAQSDAFSDDIRKIRQNAALSPSSKIRKLDPFLDADGVLRARGRINAAVIPETAKNPAILDGSHRFTKLLVAREHERAGHANNERVVNDLRQRFWILRLRPVVRTVARECTLCRCRKARPHVPLHGDLPNERLERCARPFTYVGVDYFGPLLVTVGRRREKRWGALFTCLSTRAVHLEVVSTLTTDSAIMALRRMAARRGWPAIIYSDNATNFKGADLELRKAYKEWLPYLKDYAYVQRTDWKYIAPGAPNQGGAWERLIRSVKVALEAALREKHPSDEVLRTVLAEAEHCINGRPLTHVPVTEEDPEALTPNHFLIGSSSGVPLVGPCEHATRKTWKVSQAIANEFWKRWLKEYVPTLAPRGGSASGGGTDVREGDVVVIIDGSLPRNVWPRGIVNKLYPGPDGRVRIADVQTRGGIFRRPVRKMAVLPK